MHALPIPTSIDRVLDVATRYVSVMPHTNNYIGASQKKVNSL